MRAVHSETDSGLVGGIQEVGPPDDEQLFSVISHSQRGQMDEQHCSLDAIKRTPLNLSLANATPSPEQSSEEDQAPLTLFPGAQGFRMNKNKYTIPQIVLTPGSPATGRRACSRPASPTQDDEEDPKSSALPRSVSCPGSDTERDGLQQSTQELSSKEKEQLFSVVSSSQRGRMEEQRCALQRTNKPPQASENSDTNKKAGDPDDFFQMVASSQSRRLDDQRVCMRSLPGIQPRSSCSQQNGNVVTSAKPEDSDHLCNAVSRAQRFRMDEQRCLAPGVVMLLNSDKLTRKSYSRPASPTRDTPDYQPPKRSSSFNVTSENASSSAQGEELAAADQEKFLSIMKHSQRGRMDEQRCSLNPIQKSFPVHSPANANKEQDPDHLFKLVANSQNRRLDDQRATLSPLPSPNLAKKNTQMAATQIRGASPAPATPRKAPATPMKAPASPRKTRSRTPSPTHAGAFQRPTPRSTSFCPVSDKDKMQNLGNQSTQVTFQVSMSLSPQQIWKMQEQDCAFPEVFLTLGPPGESIRVPLSPVPSRPSSLAVSPGQSPHPCGASPKRAHSRDRRTGPSSPCRGPHPSSPISPDEDYFSLIQRVHSTQIQKSTGRGETGKGKGKGDGRKEGKDGAKKKR